jgi:hypothetical protein
MAFENNALLVRLQIGKWTGKIDDKAAEREIAKAHNVVGSFGEVRKDLVTRGNMAAVQSAESELRAYHATHTQPWSTGVAILPSKIYFQYLQGFHQLRDAFDKAADAFVGNYDVLKSDAKLRLGDKYDEKDYPSADALRSKFYVSLDVLPLADPKSVVVDLAEAELAKLRENYSASLSQMEASSVERTFTVLRDTLDNLLERLRNPTTARLATIERVRDTAALLKKMNVMSLPGVDTICDDIITRICVCDMEAIKKDTRLQQELITTTEEVRHKLDQLAPRQ